MGLIGKERAWLAEKSTLDLAAEVERLRKLVWGAVHNAKNCESADRPLWSVVKHALGVGSTVARAVCREHGRDPDEAVPGQLDGGLCKVCRVHFCPECNKAEYFSEGYGPEERYCAKCETRLCDGCDEVTVRGDAFICAGCVEVDLAKD